MTTPDLDRVLQWEGLGAPWEVVHDDGTTLTVSLCQCDTGHEVDRFSSREAALRAYVVEAGRTAP